MNGWGTETTQVIPYLCQYNRRIIHFTWLLHVISNLYWDPSEDLSPRLTARSCQTKLNAKWEDRFLSLKVFISESVLLYSSFAVTCQCKVHREDSQHKWKLQTARRTGSSPALKPELPFKRWVLWLQHTVLTKAKPVDVEEAWCWIAFPSD